MDAEVEAGEMGAKAYQAAMSTEAQMIQIWATKDYSEGWNQIKLALVDFIFGTNDAFITSSFSLLEWKYILYLSHHCILYVIF